MSKPTACKSVVVCERTIQQMDFSWWIYIGLQLICMFNLLLSFAWWWFILFCCFSQYSGAAACPLNYLVAPYKRDSISTFFLPCKYVIVSLSSVSSCLRACVCLCDVLNIINQKTLSHFNVERERERQLSKLSYTLMHTRMDRPEYECFGKCCV